ncbi:type I polyketide synthase [Aestuariivita boseongensis]|uniref:type I polyketide synthase n=1 Tax=Aestuariivita boseongensis TaxID=1470562 RepID=UPI0006825743|nr:type I polyketide synthase [Aestuariivita boseongensis]
MHATHSPIHDDDIAIVGMAAHLPGAEDIRTFWENLRDGVESIRVLDEKTLLAAGERADVIGRKNYVPAAAPMDGFDMFDAEFFGFSPKEAAILDPQHRKFLEVSWAAMENAGHMPEGFGGDIGVYAGCGMGSYFYFNICSNPDLVRDVGMFLLRHTGNDKDFLCTRVSHVFDLKGPSVNLQTACSTSLVAVHYAAKALRDGDCDMALAGGVTIELPQNRGYPYRENEILSPDGHCHAFDHRAQGTVFGSGAGVVVLRRLRDALEDGDHIHAVLKGSAVNNDGAGKAGYLAPSVDGQAKAVRAALDAAHVPADSIGYVECHGTGTYLGDPIEVSALTQAYRQETSAQGFCKIGSVKTNIGHLDTAAGVAGLIKTSLALQNRQIPPSLGYEAPNPAIDFDTSPFRVNDRLSDWPAGPTPRRAAVNALGVGGTNAHVILEEAPARPASDESDWPFHILTVSARSKAALEANAANLAAHLRSHPEQDLADVAFTLKEGRRAFEKRRVVVAETHEEAARLLESGEPTRVFTHDRLGDRPETVFMFPGGGAQYPNMAQDLYETEPVFAEWMDRGLDHLQSQLEYDIRALWLPEPDQAEAAAQALQKPSVQLPLIMIVEYALAQLWLSWGVKPAALIGHSMGENTAACVAGVIRFEDCIDLVLLRGRLFDTVPKGGMLSVSLSEDDLRPLIGADLDIASVNAPGLCAVSGPQAALDRLSADLTGRGVEHNRVQIDIAAHSRMLDDILPDFSAFLQGIELKEPQIPFISNRTGQLISASEAIDPDYWVGQLRNTVLFAKGIETLSAGAPRVFLEVGPGRALSSLAQMAPAVKPGQALPSLRHPDQDVADDLWFLTTIGRLWASGIEADWSQIWGDARRNRVPLPGYAFQRSRYFIEPGKAASDEATALMRQEDMTDWGYGIAWRPAYATCDVDLTGDLSATAAQTWLAFTDDAGLLSPALTRLRDAGHRVITVTSGDSFAQMGDGFTLAPEEGRAGYDALFDALAAQDLLPDRIAHGWLITASETHRPGSSFFDRNIQHGFYSLLHLMQAMCDAGIEGRHVTVFTTGAAQVASEPLPYPEKALIAGPAGVAPREFPGLTVSSLDITLPEAPAPKGRFVRKPDPAPDGLTEALLEELLAEPANLTAALRAGKRYEARYVPAPLERAGAAPFTKGGTYLITGGFGGIGQTLAADLLTRYNANVILLGRTPSPGALGKLDGLGGQVIAMAGDVANIDDMRRVVDDATARFGRINGVLHAAGHINDAPMLTKDASSIEAVFTPKIHGLRVLDQLFPDGALDLLVLFSSSSTATQPAGQVDYVAANAYLNAFARARTGGKTRVFAVNWGVWADVGMAADAMSRRVGADTAPRIPVTSALISERSSDRGETRYHASLAPDHWIFDEHRTTGGHAVLPGTGYIELAAQAARLHGIDRPFEIRDLYFIRPIMAASQPRRIDVTLEDDGTLSIRSDATFGGHSGKALNAQASLAALQNTPGRQHIDPRAIAKRCARAVTGSEGNRLRSPQEAHLAFGPRWHVLHSMAFGDGEGLARLSLPQAARDDLTQGFMMHPALLDLATGWAMELIPGYSGAHLWVPLSYGRIAIHRALPADILSWARLRTGSSEDGQAQFDITLSDAQGDVIAEIEGFVIQQIAREAGFASAPLTEAEIQFDEGTATAPLSPDEERLLHNIGQGIRPEDGPEALHRALALGKPDLVISSLPLPALIEEAGRSHSTQPEDGASFERPELASDFVAPRNTVEEVLAGFWKKLLGLGDVGVEDSFFDLGGHSLIAVRLFAMIKREFGADFPISLLFEAPTISEIATRIAEATGRDLNATEPKAPAEAVASAPSFTHLVPLHKRDTGTPLFIVAGMFGNVLNLRQLALQVGQDRPVFGLQAKGLIGGDAPHTDIAEMARDYIAEIRQVQPHGPYLLSGFSGGGITAYEIARQLEQAGEDVAMLAMLDTPLPVRPALSRQDKALIKLQEFRRKGLGYLREWAANRLAWELAKRQGQAADDGGAQFNNTKIEMAFRQAVSAYQVTPWDGNLILFRPPLDRHWKVSGGRFVSAEREYVLYDNDWTRFAPNLTVIEVPGDHDSMVLAPNVRVLGAKLRDQIARTEQTHTAPATITAAE